MNSAHGTPLDLRTTLRKRRMRLLQARAVEPPSRSKLPEVPGAALVLPFNSRVWVLAPDWDARGSLPRAPETLPAASEDAHRG